MVFALAPLIQAFREGRRLSESRDLRRSECENRKSYSRSVTAGKNGAQGRQKGADRRNDPSLECASMLTEN